MAHSGWIAGNAIHPLVGLGLSGLLNISYLTVNEVARRSHFVGTQATFNKNVETMGKKIWAENTQVLVNEHLLSDLSSLVMDYADEVNPPRLAPYALIKGPSAQAMKGLMDRIA